MHWRGVLKKKTCTLLTKLIGRDTSLGRDIVVLLAASQLRPMSLPISFSHTDHSCFKLSHLFLDCWYSYVNFVAFLNFSFIYAHSVLLKWVWSLFTTHTSSTHTTKKTLIFFITSLSFLSFFLFLFFPSFQRNISHFH